MLLAEFLLPWPSTVSLLWICYLLGKWDFIDPVMFADHLTWNGLSWLSALQLCESLNAELFFGWRQEGKSEIFEVWKHATADLKMERSIHQKNGDLSPTNSRNWILPITGIILETDYFLATPTNTVFVWVCVCVSETLYRNSSCVVLNLWSTELGDKWVLF